MKLFFFILLIFYGIHNCYSQSLEEKISSIDTIIQFINDNKHNQNKLYLINTDGQVSKKKKVLGLFNRTKVIGGFAENFTMKDSLLIEVWNGTRIFLNNKKTISTNTLKKYVYENEKLCYYSEKKTNETENQADSLMYEIEYYIENGNILKTKIIGFFNQSLDEYLKRIIENSENKIKEKNCFEM